MDYTHFIGYCLLGFIPAMGVFSQLGPMRRARIPLLAWWLFLTVGSVICFYAMSHSTVPSFSARVTAVGKTYDYVDREIYSGYHRNSIYGFLFVPDGGDPISMKPKSSCQAGPIPRFSTGASFVLCTCTTPREP